MGALTDIGGWKRKFDFGQWHTPNGASSRISGEGEKRVAIDTKILPGGRSVQHQSQSLKPHTKTPDPPTRYHIPTSWIPSLYLLRQGNSSPAGTTHAEGPLRKPSSQGTNPRIFPPIHLVTTTRRSAVPTGGVLSWISSNLVFPSARRCNIYQLAEE